MVIVDLVMPKMGESIMEATVLRWHKKIGDTVNLDETVLDIATDKVDSEVPSTANGVITEIFFKENDIVPVGAVIAKIETAGTTFVTVTAPQPTQPDTQQQPVDNPSPAQPFITEPQQPEQVPFAPQPAFIPPPAATGNNKFFSPLVLNIANSEGLSLSELEKIPGTGAEGRVSKKDILQYIADKKTGKVAPFIAPQPVYQSAVTQPQPIQVEFQQPQPVYITTQPPAEAVIKPQPTEPVYIAPPVIETPKPSVEIIEMDRMRKLIAQHMVSSKQISAHVTSFAEADVTNMVMWREKKKEDFEKRTGIRITFTPMFIECLIKVMKRYPIINSSVEDDKITIKNYFNIGMATALPNNNLIVPVIKNAEQMGLVNLAKSVNALAANARNGKLKPDDTQSGTFTLTNVGSFGSLMGTPIINQPQVAILAVGAIKKRPVVLETDKGDFIGIRHMMYLSLSYDHRIIDGSVGASFLTEVAKEFENWNVNRELKLIVQEQYVD
jgi:2-oxoglutarate dehydrogenase E2 component (dihydrolipoamide succinyltransferase)